jgi:hypothetical protein
MSRKARGGISWPITGYVGANGAGKTLSMVEDLAVPVIGSDHVCGHGVPKTILANFRVNAPNFVQLRSWRQLVEAHNAVILLDEISAVLPSRQAMSMPPQLLRVLNQLRKAECQLGWSAPAWARCDLALREVTQAAVVCRGYLFDGVKRQRGTYSFPRRGPAVKDPGGKRVGLEGWGANCLFSVSYYDAREFDDFSYGKVEGIKAASHKWYWRPGHKAQLAYDTLEGVDLLDHLDDVGACMTCGGSRPRRKCECSLESPFVASVAEAVSDGAVVAESVEVAGTARSAVGGTGLAVVGGRRKRRELVDSGGSGDVRDRGRPSGHGGH